jgi:hypothetical protein
MITILWPDGKITTGRAWEDIEDAIRAAQWHTFKTKREFRREMRRRAEVWSGERPRRIRSLAELGMFMIMEEETNE